MSPTPIDGLLARTGGVRGLVYTALPVTTFAVTSSLLGLQPAIAAAIGAAAIILAWQLMRRESTRPALWGFVGVAVCAVFALVTGEAKDFYLPGIWMQAGLATVFTVSVLIRRPIVGVVWAWATGRDQSWRHVRRVRLAFELATMALVTAQVSRFVVQRHFYDTDQTQLLAVARVAMGWPVFVLTTTLTLLAIRYAIRALPRTAGADEQSVA